MEHTTKNQIDKLQEVKQYFIDNGQELTEQQREVFRDLWNSIDDFISSLEKDLINYYNKKGE